MLCVMVLGARCPPRSEAQLKKLIRQFAPGASGEKSLVLAERAAAAQLELAPVRWVPNAMIERALTLFDPGDAGPREPDLEGVRHRIAKSWRQAIKSRGSLPRAQVA